MLKTAFFVLVLLPVSLAKQCVSETLPIISRVSVAEARAPAVAPATARVSTVHRDGRAIVLPVSLRGGIGSHCLLLFGQHLPVDLVVTLLLVVRQRLRRLILRGR